MNLKQDIYYSKSYVSLYLEEDESLFEFDYCENEKQFYHLSIKRPITLIGNVPVSGYFDLETAYGYGGFFANTGDVNFLSKAMQKYQEKCNQENIIAEFFRFHPASNSPQLLKDHFDFLHNDRNVVVINLEETREERWKNYSSTTRNILRKAEKLVQISRTENLEAFIDLYYSTMKKNNADQSYFFKREYFENLIKIPSIELYEAVYNDQIISMSFFMFSDEFGHYHLSANDINFSKLSGNYLILDHIFELAKNKNKKLFILGGGLSGSPDDKLLSFKMKFSKRTMPFYIGGKIYRKDIFDRYNSIWKEQSVRSISYFLKYRLIL